MMLPSNGNSSIRLIMSRISGEVLFVEFEIKFSKASISSPNVTFLSWSRKGSIMFDILLTASQGTDLFERRLSDSSLISFAKSARTSLFSAIIYLIELYDYSQYHCLFKPIIVWLIYSGGTEVNFAAGFFNMYYHQIQFPLIYDSHGQTFLSILYVHLHTDIRSLMIDQ